MAEPRRSMREGRLAAWLQVLLAALTFALLTLSAGDAAAHPWMIRDGFSGCATCHADPSGGDLLNAWGRAEGDRLLRSTYGDDDTWPRSSSSFLFGVWAPPDDLLLGAAARGGFRWSRAPGAPAQRRFSLMRADAHAQLAYENLVLDASLGYADEGSLPAAITHGDAKNLVSREHWVGVRLNQGKTLLRAGRIALPFGIRDVDATLLTRSATRTDLEASQQHGVALSIQGEATRGEIMAIAGNLQVNPTYFQERGYSGFIETSLRPDVSVGLSSLLTRATKDVTLRLPLIRHAHGAFARLVPFRKLVLLAEGDALFAHPSGAPSTLGYVGVLQADLEVLPGFHVLSTGEVLEDGGAASAPSAAGRVGFWWFFAPHADARVEAIQQRIATPAGSISATSLLTQLHVSL